MSNLVAFKVYGGAMEPSLHSGDIVIVDLFQVPESNGQDIGVFIYENNKLIISKFTYYNFQILLLFENAPYKVILKEKIEIIGKVVNVLKKEKNHSVGNTMVLMN